MEDFSHYKFEDVFTASDGYASRFAGETGEWLLSVQEKTILSLLKDKIQAGSEMLDVGGAHGQLIPVARALNLRLKIAASHQDAVSFLSKRTNQAIHADVTEDLFNLPYRDNSYKLVSSVRLISHIDPWQKHLEEICRVSSEYVLIDYPPLVSSNLLNTLLFPLKKKMEGNTRTFTIFKHSEIDAEFKRNGYQLVARKGQFFWPMVVHRKIKSVRLSNILEFPASFLGLQKIFGNPVIALYQKL